MGQNGQERRKDDRRKGERRQAGRRDTDPRPAEAVSQEDRIPELENELARVRSTLDARAALDAQRAERRESERGRFRRRRRT